MKWLLVVLFLNVQPGGWEVHGQDFESREDCRSFAKDINEKMDFANEEANRLGKLQVEQVYAWCEKK